MRRLNWNDEYYLRFIYNGKRCVSHTGFMSYFDAKDEKLRLKSLGATDIKIAVRKWN